MSDGVRETQELKRRSWGTCQEGAWLIEQARAAVAERERVAAEAAAAAEAVEAAAEAEAAAERLRMEERRAELTLEMQQMDAQQLLRRFWRAAARASRSPFSVS